VAIILVLLGMVTLLSIGILLLPVGMAMLVAAGYWGRPRLVVAITAAAVAFSAAYALTAPWSCTETTFLGEGSRVTRTCSRLALPDLPRFAQGRDYGLAFGLAGLSAAAVGIGTVRLGRRLTTGTTPSRP